MLHGLIITNHKSEHSEYKIKRFFEEAKDLDIDLKVYVNDGSLAYFKDGQIYTKLQGDFVIYLDKDIYLAKILEAKGFKVFNNSNFIRACDDKLLTYISLLGHDIEMPKTMSSPLIYDDQLEEKHFLFLKEVEKEIGYPLVFKKAFGSLGEGVFIAHNYDELKDLYSKYFKVPILFQSYIKTSYGKSVRVLVIDGKIFGAFERINNLDFRSNFKSGAYSRPYELSKKYRDFAEKIIDIMHIDYAGIDLLHGEDDEPVLCEINSNAFFEEFEKVTGKNVAREYLKMIKRKMNYE